MSQIAYDPVKDRFAARIRHSRALRRVFYFLLDLFFLRSWHVRRRLRQELAANPRAVILDAGCGFGQYDRYLLRRFPHVRIHAVDVKPDYLDACRHYFQADIAAGRIRFAESDLTIDTFPPEYDLVLCVDVLEHIEPDVQVMRTLRGALKPGGVLVMHSPSHLAEDDAEGDPSFVGEHARPGYSREELDAKLRQAGFEGTDIRYTYGPDGHRAWEWLIKRPMLWLSAHFAWVLVLPFWYLVTLIPGLWWMRKDLDWKGEGTGILGVGLAKPEGNP